MYCTKCGKKNEDGAAFCSGCGERLTAVPASQVSNNAANIGMPQMQPASASYQPTGAACDAKYILPQTPNRECAIYVYQDRVEFYGKFMYLRDKDFYKANTDRDYALTNEFIGIGPLAMRSWKKTLTFVVMATVMEIIKSIVDWCSDMAEKADKVTSLVGHRTEMPAWPGYIVNIIAFACLVYAIVLFFSKKKVIEISFLSKRICIPQDSITYDEMQRLNYEIKGGH